MRKVTRMITNRTWVGDMNWLGSMDHREFIIVLVWLVKGELSNRSRK
jgi:hypothetical protein